MCRGSVVVCVWCEMLVSISIAGRNSESLLYILDCCIGSCGSGVWHVGGVWCSGVGYVDKREDIFMLSCVLLCCVVMPTYACGVIVLAVCGGCGCGSGSRDMRYAM